MEHNTFGPTKQCRYGSGPCWHVNSPRCAMCQAKINYDMFVTSMRNDYGKLFNKFNYENTWYRYYDGCVAEYRRYFK